MEIPTRDELNASNLRIELSQVMLMQGDGQTRFVNSLRLYRLDEDARGRTKAVQILPGPIVATDKTKEPTYAELLEAAVRILTAEAPGSVEVPA